jgi:hypothetical protein
MRHDHRPGEHAPLAVRLLISDGLSLAAAPMQYRDLLEMAEGRTGATSILVGRQSLSASGTS